MASSFIKIETEPKRVVFGGTHEIEDEFLYECFKAEPAERREEVFKEFLTVGAYAYKEDRLHTFFRRLEGEVEGRLEELKVLYKVRQLNELTTQKGAAAEKEAVEVLREFAMEKGWPDEVRDLSTTPGRMAGRKVGDLLIEIGTSNKKIVIEAKVDKAVQLGDPTSTDNRDLKLKSEKSAYGQNLTSLANRDADVAIIFLDKSSMSPQITTIASDHNGILFHPELPGFVVVVDKERGDWTNLQLAYSLARWIALLEQPVTDYRRVDLALKRLVRDTEILRSLDNSHAKATKAAQQTLDSLEAMTAVIAGVAESAKVSQELVKSVLAGEQISEEDWKVFYDEEVV